MAAPVTLGLGIPLLSMGERRAIKNKSQKRGMEKKGRQEGRKREKKRLMVGSGMVAYSFIPVLGRQKQVHFSEFKVSLFYVLSFRPDSSATC